MMPVSNAFSSSTFTNRISYLTAREGLLLVSQKIQVRNKCSKLPLGAVWQVRRSLRWINPDHLTGIRYVELIDKLPDVEPTSPDWYKEVRQTTRGTYGWYNEQTETDCAGIVLHMPDLCYGIPRFLWWTTVPTLLIAKVLAHEVAHHLQVTRGYISSLNENFKRDWQEEAAADRYAFDLIRRMRQKWSCWLGHEVIDITAQAYYRLGVKSWEEKNYAKAASYWYKVMRLDSDHTYAAHWYWRALEISQTNQSGPGKMRDVDKDSH